MRSLSRFRWAVVLFLLTSGVTVTAGVQYALRAAPELGPAASTAFRLAAVTAAVFGVCLTVGLVVLATQVAGWTLRRLQTRQVDDVVWEGAAYLLMWMSASSLVLLWTVRFSLSGAASAGEVEMFLGEWQTRNTWLVYGAALLGGGHAAWLLRKRGCDWLDASIAVSMGALAVAVVAGVAALIT